MEAELNESSKIGSKTDNLEVIIEANVDEAIPIYFQKELMTKVYKRTMNIDNEEKKLHLKRENKYAQLNGEQYMVLQ